MGRISTVHLFFIVILCCTHSKFLSQDGSLDSSFGNGGIVMSSISEMDDVAHDILQQPDGKILVAGTSNHDFILLRFLADGSLDTSFGNDGVVIENYENNDDEGLALALQEDGKILLGGRTFMDFALLRFNSDGSLDLNFGTDGIVKTDIAGDYDVGRALGIQADGKIVMAGTSDSSSIITLIRYNPDGSLDGTFGEDGISMIEYESGFDIAHAMQIQDNGKLVIAGSTYVDIVLLRYNQDGNLDTSFGENGRVMTDLGANYEAGKSLLIQPDGKILIGGYSSEFLYDTFFALIRYNSNGNLDDTFNGTGVVTADIGPDYSRGNSIALQPDGKIIIAGYMSYVGMTLLRYNTNGSIDYSFSQDGIVTTTIGDDSEANSILIQADGKILVAGMADMNDNLEIVLARYNSGLTIGLDEYENVENLINVYPNPVIGKSTLEIVMKGETTLTIDLLDISGKNIETIIERTLFSKGLNRIKINLSEQIPSGVYILKIHDDQGKSYYVRFLKGE